MYYNYNLDLDLNLDLKKLLNIFHIEKIYILLIWKKFQFKN
jgi:hypothetical protein